MVGFCGGEGLDLREGRDGDLYTSTHGCRRLDDILIPLELPGPRSRIIPMLILYSWNHRPQYQQAIRSSKTLGQTVARLPGLQHVRVATIGQHQLSVHCYIGCNN